MKYQVFSVYDSKAEAFLPPWVLPKKAQAVRAFADCINSPDHQFGNNPADYTLFVLAAWDDSTGEYNIDGAKYSLGNGVEFIETSFPEELNVKDTQSSVKKIPDEPPVQRGTSSANSTKRV